MKRLLGIVFLSVVIAWGSMGPVAGQSTGAKVGEITVYNESGFDVEITISDKDRGKLEAGYSKTYRVPLGEHRVEAETDSRYDKSGYKDFVISGTYPYDSWYLKNSDLN